MADPTTKDPTFVAKLLNLEEPMIDESHIRVARVADFDTVGALLIASYSSLLASCYDHDLLRRALPHISRANRTLLASGTYYVAEIGLGKLVGCGGWTIANPESGEIVDGEAHIRHFATHPEWVRQGVGTSLLSRCFRDARSLSMRQLHCFSTLNAERFYRASGFDMVREIDIPVESDLTLPGILMAASLRSIATPTCRAARADVAKIKEIAPAKIFGFTLFDKAMNIQ